jgi:hypothetical protein
MQVTWKARYNPGRSHPRNFKTCDQLSLVAQLLTSKTYAQSERDIVSAVAACARKVG